MNLIRNNTTVEYQILMCQLAMRNEKDHTFINRIQEVIQKYKLEPVEKLMEQPGDIFVVIYLDFMFCSIQFCI
jgi:hypothetical protein